MTMMEHPAPTRRNYTVIIVALVLALGLVLGGGLGYVSFSGQVSQLQQKVNTLQSQFQNAGSSTSGTSSTSTSVVISGNVSVSDLYAAVKNSVVVITGMVSESSFFGTTSSEVQGSGFVYSVGSKDVMITNYHVVDGATAITVTFSDGDSYAATVIGTDPYSDLAVLTVQAPSSEFIPLTMVSSTTK